MATTTYLDVTLIEESQSSKYVTANEATEAVTACAAGSFSVDLGGLSGDVTPTALSMLRCLYVYLSGALAGAVSLIVPDSNKGYWVNFAGTGYDVTIKTVAGTGVTLSTGEAQLVYCDGTNVVAISAVGAGGAAEATAKIEVNLTGTGGTSDLSIGGNVDANSVELYKMGIRLRRNTHYSVTESVPASGNYDTIHPLITDILTTGDDITVLYYAA